MKNLKDKVAVITGAGSGIGRGLALELEKEGCLLALMDKDEAGLKETIALLTNSSKIYSEVFDVSEVKAFVSFANNVIQYFNHVDIVVNNAGVALATLTIEELSYEQFDWILRINLWGVIYGSKIFLPHLLQRPEASLLNVSSSYGLMAASLQGAYTTTKFAVRGFTETLRSETIDTNLTVSCVYPGSIKTNILDNSKGWGDQDKTSIQKAIEKGMLHSPEKAGQIIIKGIKKKKSRILIGQEAYIVDWAVRSFPDKYAYVTNKIIQTIVKK